MKKILLGVIALTSAASFGAKYEHLHGYLELDGKASVEKPVSYEDVSGEVKVKDLGDQKDVTYEIGTKADLGVFMHENKEVFAFIGTDLSGKKVGNADLTFNEKTPYHFGLRWDSEIIDTFNIQLTAAHRRGGEGIAWETKNKLNDETEKVHKVNGVKYAIEKHLTAKGKKLDGTDQGYKLRQTDTFLLSAVLNGKIYNNFELTVAGLYNSADFKDGTHELETYVKTNGKIRENVKVSNAVIRHVLNSENYAMAGALNGGVKVETEASDVVTLSNEGKFELKNILKNGNGGHDATVESLNSGKYTGIKNVELRGDVNYKLEIKTTSALTTLKHEPEAKLGVTYKPVAGLTLSSDNSNKVTYKHEFTPAAEKAFTNDFITTNKVAYAVAKGVMVDGLAEYKLNTNLSSTAQDPKHAHSVLAGAGVSVNKEFVGAKVESTLNGRYLFDAKSADAANNFTHQGFVWTENKVAYAFNDNNKLEGKVNLYNYTKLKTITKNSKHELNGNVADVFLANLGAKYTNVTGKFTNVVDVDAKYALETELVKDAVVKQGLGVDFNGSTTFKANENVDVTFGVENTYTLNEFNGDIYGVYVDYIKDASNYKADVNAYAADKYNASKQDSIKKAKDTIKDMTAGAIDLTTVKHDLSVNPKLSAKFTYVDGKLTVNPWVGAGFDFANKGATPQEKFALRKITGKGGVKVNYVW
ncbi:hypothetical protein [Streptobacillus canis]|uniref:hypothetical protein n=1 Tax=Streptobacillus canis TaxID=2678686 RepID=UPI0012E1437D|nr:hypothetical protein [Streptobacillus canis]